MNDRQAKKKKYIFNKKKRKDCSREFGYRTKVSGKRTIIYKNKKVKIILRRNRKIYTSEIRHKRI